MNSKIAPYIGKTVADFLKDKKINMTGFDQCFLNEVIDKEYFICDNCSIIIHNSNESEFPGVCIDCKNPDEPRSTK